LPKDCDAHLMYELGSSTYWSADPVNLRQLLKKEMSSKKVKITSLIHPHGVMQQKQQKTSEFSIIIRNSIAPPLKAKYSLYIYNLTTI